MTAKSLVELAEQVTTGVQRGAQKERVAEQVTQLKRVEDGVAQLRSVVTTTAQLVRAALGAGVDVPVAGLRQLAGPLSKVAAEGGSGNVDGTLVDRLIVEARSQLSSMQSAITIGWREVVDRKVPQRDGLMRLAETFRQLDTSSGLASELRQIVGQAQQLAGSPPSIDALDRLDRIAARIPEVLRDLVGEEPSVRAFADRVARRGAPLDTVTPEVMDWLLVKGFHRSFKVVPGEPEA